jgi:S-adenosylmethionine hydrolase
MKASGIITLATDFGLSDPYVAMMKGVILSINPSAKLIDISHQISVGSILQGASLIQETYPFFPMGTVHLAVIDPGVGGNRHPIAIQSEGQFFVGPDNGLFWPAINGQKEVKVIHLTESRYFLDHITYTFHGREVFAPVAAHLSLGIDVEKMGSTLKDPVQLNLPKSVNREGTLYGQVIRMDNFGNLITNIHHKELQAFLKSAQPIIEVGKLIIKKMSQIYSDVSEGEPLALINSSNCLEIAVNLGRASAYLGMDSGEIIGVQVKVNRWR